VLPNVVTGETRLYSRPQFSPDGALLLVDAFLANGGVVNAIVDLETGTVVEAPLTSPQDTSALTARWLSDGRFMVYRDTNSLSTLAPGFYIYGANAPGASPSQWLPLDTGVSVLSVVEPTPGQLRAVLADAGGALRVVDIVFGNQAVVRALERLDAPRLSPDGQYVAGLEGATSESGALTGTLTLIDLGTGAGYRLSSPQAGSAFRWAQRET
jgi:dipeptidyl aminopeptidase/acylaminoacyl peptidase